MTAAHILENKILHHARALLGYWPGRRKAERFYRQSAAGREGIEMGSLPSLSLLPLIDYYADQPGLATEPGVSYLVRAGGTTILFDLGLNLQEETPPPLLRNMERLGIDPSTIDLVVISHPHSDHLGGMTNKLARRAILCEPNDPLAGKPVYSTVPLEVSGGESKVVEHPQLLAPGVATTGPLPVELLVLGYTLEQSIVVNVEGCGLVIIIGCGHPGIARIVESAERTFNQQVYGVIGGLHYPVTDDRRRIGFLKPQKLFGNPEPPWRPISRKTVYRSIEYLKAKNVRLVSLSPHDSCDWAIGAFAEAFGEHYHPLKAGREIRVGAAHTKQNAST